MSVNGFFEGLDAGVNTGIKLGHGIAKGQDRRGTREVSDILAEMSGMNAPGIGQGPGGIPVEGQETTEAPVGHDGVAWDDTKGRALKALNRVTDMKTRIALEKQIADMEKSKVMEYGNLGLAALDQGDLDGAQRYFAGLSYFMDPGSTPTTIVTPDGKLVVQDEDGTQQGFNRQGIIDMMHRMENFDGWAGLTFDRQRHADDMARRDKALASEIEYNNAKLALDERKTDAAIASDEATAEYRRTQNVTALDSNARANEAHDAKLSADEASALATRRKASLDRFESKFLDPKSVGSDGEEPDPYAVDDGKPAHQALSEDLVTDANQAANLDTSMIRQERAMLRKKYQDDPSMQATANVVLDIINNSAQGQNMSAEAVADIAYTILHGKGGNFGVSGDRSQLNYGSEKFEVSPEHQQALQGLIGTVQEQPAPNAAPAPESGIPEG